MIEKKLLMKVKKQVKNKLNLKKLKIRQNKKAKI